MAIPPTIQSIDEAKMGLRQAIETYATSRVELAEQCGGLPGHFLDSEGARNEQHGLTAIPLWLSISKHSANENVVRTRSSCENVMKRLRHPKRKYDSIFFSNSNIKWEHIKHDYEEIIVKRCLCLIANQSKEEALKDIENVINFAFRETENGSEHIGYSGRIGSVGGYNATISVYAMMAVMNCIEFFEIECVELAEELRRKIKEIMLRIGKECTEIESRKVNNYFILKLYMLNCLYRYEVKDMYTGNSGTRKRNIRNILCRIYEKSKEDPLEIGTDIVMYYRAMERDRYFRFNSDVILAESYYISFNENQKCFQMKYGNELFDRIVNKYSGKAFNLDPNGQRLTIYSIFHVANFWNRVTEQYKTQQEGSILGLHLWIFDKKAMTKAGIMSGSLIVLAFVVLLLSQQFNFPVLKDFAKLAILTAVLPIAEYFVSKIVDRAM